jgi:multiple sugar transport system substrate-binding protein
MMKRISFAVLIALLVMVGAVVAQDDPLADVDPTGVTIVYWHEWQGNQQTGIDEVIRLFEESNEFGITVEQVQLGSGGAITERLAAGVVSGELPNLAGNGFLNTAQGLFLDGVLEPMEVYFDHPVYGLTEEELAAFDLSVVDVNRSPLEPFNDELLAFPTGISAEMMYVNLEMLEELNAAGEVSFSGRAPETLDEFREFMCASTGLTAPDGTDVRGFPFRTSPFSYYPFINANGGFLFDEEANAYNFTNEGVITTLDYLRGMLNDDCGYIFDTGFTSSVFGAAQVPMANGSSVGLPFIQSAIADSGSGLENWEMALFPGEERVLQSYLRGVQILNQTPEENLATWLFVKFWQTSPEAQVAWTQGANYQPFYGPARDGLPTEFLEGSPQFTDVFNIVGDDSVRIYSTPSHPRVNEIHDILGNFIISAITTDDDIMELAAEAEEEANEVYEEILEEIADAAM